MGGEDSGCTGGGVGSICLGFEGPSKVECRECRTKRREGIQETHLYCCTHKVPVCGDCICFPEHSACEVRTYAECMVDSTFERILISNWLHVLHANHKAIFLCWTRILYCH
ncbi:hypothetical protein SUGI_0547220 [Cryptomeria japonica]|nr:hypothetical protein SUGI_0547220 [Cryptomeria japonica]